MWAPTSSPLPRPVSPPSRCRRSRSPPAKPAASTPRSSPALQTQTVVVTDDPIPVITTDVSNLAETKVGDELVDLPVAIYSRSTGSTSPISTLTTESGVQTDDSGNLDVMGTTAALLSVTIDGISSVGVEYSGPVNEMFPSFNSIEEIRVSESNNNAEFSGVADITTVSKAGTIHYHGGLFENNENTVFNSNNTFALSKPRIIMNDFGGTLGGPLTIPHLVPAPNQTFFFASFEGLRLPRQTPMLLSVPSDGHAHGQSHQLSGRAGRRSHLSARRNHAPRPGQRARRAPSPPACSNISSPRPTTARPVPTRTTTRSTFPRPSPPTRATSAWTAPFPRGSRSLRASPTRTARFITAPSAACTFTYCAEAGSPLQGAYNTPEIDEGLTFAHNFVFIATAAQRVPRRLQRPAHLRDAELLHHRPAGADRLRLGRPPARHRVV